MKCFLGTNHSLMESFSPICGRFVLLIDSRTGISLDELILIDSLLCHFQGTANLQSSINAKDGLGTVSLSAIYAAIVVSCIFIPTLVIRRLTVKWTLCASMICYAPYIGAQFYPK